MANLEVEKNIPVDTLIKERPTTPEIPEHIEKGGVSKTDPTFNAQVTDDYGNNIILAPEKKDVTITLPGDTETMEEWSRGKIVNAITWLGKWGIRMMKKAFHFGWKTIVGNK